VFTYRKENPVKTALSSAPETRQHNMVSPVRPIPAALAFFLIVLALRSIDLFVLKLDGLPDELIFSRAAGFLLVLGFLRVLRKPVRSIGLHARNLDKAALLGGLALLSVYAGLYAFQFYRLSTAGETPRLVFAAIDPETGAMGGLFFTSFSFFGQIVNAFMEEAIFRGLMLPLFMLKFRFWKANLLQAFLFGLAHLVFPLSSWASGQATAGEAIAGAASLLFATTVGGLIFGYLYYRTDSLWTAVLAHLTDNAIGLFFHIQTASRLNAETDILMLASLGFIGLMPLAWVLSRRFNLPTLKPWEANSLDSK
jgi:membrane protease YdiL (CAAX protease family)